MARITEKTLKSLKAPSAGNEILYDDEVPGFGVRITANGVVSFVLNYRVHGRERRYTIGRYPEYSATAARDEAIALRKQVREGKDPLEAREKSYAEPLLSDLAKDYLERYAQVHKRTSSLRNDRQMLQTIILPRLGNIRVQAAGRRDIEALHHSLKATPYRANRVLALLSKMFSLGVEWQWRTDNPTKGVQRYHEEKRQTWLSADQLEQFDKALSAYPGRDAADALRLLILTGSREGEVLSATWDQFDLDRGVWTKPSHHTKQKRIEHVPLSKAALVLLEKMALRKNGSPYLFPGRYGEKARVSLKNAWRQVCKAAGLATEVRIPGKRGELIRYKPTVRIHDLRHTFASHLVSKGESLHIVGKLLGHTQPQTTARYAHLSDEALRDATNRFGDILRTSKKRATLAR